MIRRRSRIPCSQTPGRHTPDLRAIWELDRSERYGTSSQCKCLSISPATFRIPTAEAAARAGETTASVHMKARLVGRYRRRKTSVHGSIGSANRGKIDRDQSDALQV